MNEELENEELDEECEEYSDKTDYGEYKDLITEIRDTLDITWSDPDTDRKVRNIFRRSIGILDNYANTEIDYNEDMFARELLMNLCRYIWDNDYEHFKANYSMDIIALRAQYRAGETDEL